MEVSHWPFPLAAVEPSIKIPELGSAEAAKAGDIVHALNRAQCSEKSKVRLYLGFDLHMTDDAPRLVFATHVTRVGLLDIYAEILETDSLRKMYQRKRAARCSLLSIAWRMSKVLRSHPEDLDML